jgi:non-heme chloroperoxidase
MPTITSTDGTEIFYKDWGTGQPIVFSHGWPLSADDWDTQMLFFLEQGYRVIAHDRRGHGRSAQVGDGHDMDHYADDLAAVTAHLDLKDAIHVGHSTGGGEVVHYIARHGARREGRADQCGAAADGADPSKPRGGFAQERVRGPASSTGRQPLAICRALPSGPFYESIGPVWNRPKRLSRTGGARA